MAYTQVGDVRMYYDDLGRPEGLPIVMLHGFSATGRADWNAQIETLAEEYRLIVPDLRGHGRSDNPAGRPAMNHRQFAEDIALLCDGLGMDRSAFIGTSTGSMLQLSLALNRPDLVAAAVLAASTYFWSTELRTSLGSQTVDELANVWFPEPKDRQRFTMSHTALGPDHWRVVLGDFIGLFSHEHAEDFPDFGELAAIKAPVLLVHGDRDHLFAPEIAVELYRQLDHAELCVLPNTGHWPAGEQPQAFNSLAHDFLARHYR
jgi:pimeloyl-ACP methyl ester carboxylesterase